MAPPVIMSAGGLDHISTVLAGIDPNFVEPWYPTAYAPYAYATPEFLVSFGILLMVGLACAPHVVNNVLAAKEARYFKWAPLVAFAIYAIVMFLVKFVGFAVRSLVEEGTIVLPAAVNAQDYSFIVGVEHAMPNVAFWALFAVIVLAAVMSTTDRLMLTVRTSFAWDVYRTSSVPPRPIRGAPRLQIAIVLGPGTLLLAINPPPMLSLADLDGDQVMLATFAVRCSRALLARRAGRAIASMAVSSSSGSSATGQVRGALRYTSASTRSRSRSRHGRREPHDRQNSGPYSTTRTGWCPVAGLSASNRPGISRAARRQGIAPPAVSEGAPVWRQSLISFSPCPCTAGQDYATTSRRSASYRAPAKIISV